MTPNEFLARMVGIFGKAYHDDSGDIGELLERQLGEFEPEVLRKASEAIVLGRDKRGWPMPAEILSICRTTADQVRAARNWENAGKPDNKRDPWSDESIHQADRMVLCELGYEAAQDGWIIPLHGHLRETGAYPDAGEIAKLKRAGLKLANNIARSRKLPVAALGRASEQREAELKTRIEAWADAEALRHHPMAAG